MLLSSRKNIVLVATPLVLLALLLSLSNRRPHPLRGNSGPAKIASQAVVIDYAPDGDILCGTTDGTLQSYNASDRSFKTLGISGEGITAQGGAHRLIFSKDGKFVMVGVRQPRPKVLALDRVTHKIDYSFDGPTGSAFDVSADGHWAAVGIDEGIRIVDLTARIPTPPKLNPTPSSNHRFFKTFFFKTEYQPASAAFSPDSKHLAVGVNGQIILFDMAAATSGAQAPVSQVSIGGGQPTTPVAYKGNSKLSGSRDPFWMEWSPDSSKLAVFATNEIALFDNALKKLANTSASFNTPGGILAGGITNISGANLVWSADGQTLFSGGDEVRRWSGDLKLEASYGIDGPVALSPDGKYMLTTNQSSGSPYPFLMEWKVG